MKKKFFGGEHRPRAPWIIPGVTGWFYMLKPIDTSPGSINDVRHVKTGERPLRAIARFEAML